MLDRYGEALAVFRELENENDDNFDAHLGIAWCSIKLGQFSVAEEYLEKADDSRKTWQRYFVEDANGWLKMQQGDLEAAEEHFRNEDYLYIPFQDPAADAKVSRGWISIRQGNWEKAIEFFEGGIDRDDKCFFCYDGLSRAALAEQDYEKALEKAVEGLKINRYNAGLRNLVTSALAGINDPAKSKETYEDLIKTWPKVAYYRAALGYVALAEGDQDGAEKLFREALEVEEDSLLARAGIADMQFFKTVPVKEGWEAYAKGDFEAALKIFDTKAKTLDAQGSPAAQDGRGWALLALDRPQEARDAFVKAKELDSEFFYADSGKVAAERALLTLYNQAWSLIGLARYDEATEALNRSRTDTPKDMQWLIDDGLAYIDYYKGDYDKAESAFGKIVASNPEAYLSKAGLGLVAMEKGDFGKAATNIIESLTQNPYQALATFTAPANRFIEEGQYTQARQILEMAERTYPASADVQFLFAKAAFGAKDDATAARKANAAAFLAPTYIDPVFDEIKVSNVLLQDGLLSLGYGLYYGGQSEKALQRLTAYKEAGGTSNTANLYLGWSNLALQKYDEAEDFFDDANDDKDLADAHAGLGYVNLGKDDVEDAEKSFRKALELLPGHFAASNGLANIQFRKTALVTEGWEAYYKGEYEEALKAFDAKRSEAKSDDNPAAEDGRGWTLLAMGKNKEASSAFKAALKIDPSFFYSSSGLIAAERAGLTLYNIAWSQSEAGQFDQARKTFARAKADMKPEFLWLIDDGLAWVKFYEKDYDSANAMFTEVLKKEPNAYLSMKGLGYVALEKGQLDEAAQHVAESVRLNPYQGVSTYSRPVEKLIEAGKNTTAKDLLDLGLRVYPASVDLQFQMAKNYVATNDKKTAGLHVAYAASLAPTYINPVFDDLKLSKADAQGALVNLAWGLYFSRDNDGALKRFAEAKKAGVKDPNLDRGRAFALFRKGEYKKAIPLLQAAMKLEPKTLLPIDEIVPIPGTSQSWTIRYSAASTLAWAYLRSGQTSKAAKEFQTVLKENPFWADALTGYGYVLLEQKKNGEAKSSFEKALNISPFYPDARQGLQLTEQS